MKALVYMLLIASGGAQAQGGFRTDSASLLEAARQQGYSFTLTDVKVYHDPEWAAKATTTVLFEMANPKFGGQPIKFDVDTNGPDVWGKIDAQADELCRKILDISAAQIPGAQVRQKKTAADGNGLTELGCALILPAR